MIFSLEKLCSACFFRVFKWNVIFVCGYGCEKKTIIQKINIIKSKYVWLWGEEQHILMHIVGNEIGEKYFRKVLHVWLWMCVLR